MKWVVGFTMLALAACSTTPSPVVSKTIVAAEQSLTLAEKLALRYTSLPACTATVKIVCHDPATKQKIKDLDNVAYRAVMAARTNEALLGVAITAIGDLSSAIP
jgi:hypothetical protein